MRRSLEATFDAEDVYSWREVGDSVRFAHKRKRNFLKLLDAAKLG